MAPSRLRSSLAAVALALAWPALAEQAPEPPRDALSPTKISAIEAVLRAAMERHGIPGLSAAVAGGSRVLWSEGLGLADVENEIPARANTVYRFGSISKSITATAALQLVEQGRLDLDAPVQKYVPAFPEKAWPLTTRQLLAHVGGIRHYAGEEWEITRHYASLGEALSLFKDDPLSHEPGTHFLYTTHGYTLVGCAIEGASGMRYVDYVRENVFAPAGMETARPDAISEIIPGRAQGYHRTAGGELLNSGLADTSYKIPGGGLCGSAVDLARFAIALMDGVLIRKETLQLMATPQKLRDGHPISYGLGFALDRWRGLHEVYHTGGQQRVSSILYLIPESHLAVALLMDLEDVPDRPDLARRVAEVVLR